MRAAAFASIVGLVVTIQGCGESGTLVGGPTARFALASDAAAGPPPFTDVPWPSDAYLRDGHVVAPPALDRVFVQNAVLLGSAMAKLDGFSQITPALFWVDDTSLPPDGDGLPAPADIDPTSLPASETECTADTSAAFLVDLDAAQRVPCRSELHDDRAFGSTTRPLVVIGPARGVVLAPRHHYAAVLTSRVHDSRGRALAAGADFARIAGGGRSGPYDALYGGALATVQAVLGPALASDGAQVVAIAPFTTSGLTQELFDARAVVDARPAPTLAWDAASLAPMGAARFAATIGGALPAGFTASLDDWLGVVAPTAKLPDGTDDPDGTLPVRAHDRIAAVGTAVFTAASFLTVKPGGYADPDHANFAHDASGKLTVDPDHPTERIWVTFAVPAAAMPPDGYPAVVFAHGAGESRVNVMDAANTFCEKGWIVAAIDSVTFGARAPEAQYQVDAHTDWENAPGAGYRGPDGFADAVNGSRNGPADLFGDLMDIGAMRDQMRQAEIDDVQLVKMLRADPDLSPLATGGVVPRVDPQRIAFVGNSLGSIEGAAAAAVLPEVRAWLLNVAGGGLLLEAAPNAPTAGSLMGLASSILFGFRHDWVTGSHPMTAMMQWLTEAGDPLPYARWVVQSPRPIGGVATSPRDIVQVEVLYDTFAADESGEALARALGLPMAVPNVGSNAGIRDLRHLDANPQRLDFPQAAPDPAGVIHDVPVAGTTAVLVQTSPGQHGFDFFRSHAQHTYAIPFAQYDTGTPFVSLDASKYFDVRCAYRSLQAMTTRFFDDAFSGHVPGVAGFQPPVRDYDDDGVTDDVDPDPSDPRVR